MKVFFHAFLYIVWRKKKERRKEEREGQWVGGKKGEREKEERKEGNKERKLLVSLVAIKTLSQRPISLHQK